MSTASWRPALWVSSAFNADPNDPSVPPAWSDLSSPFFIAADGVTRGRQYELDQNQASQPSFTFLDQSEDLNPANTSSPYYPNVKPLRQLLFQAMWPNTSSGNLMNANQGASSILGTTSAGYDPSFDSYTAGSTVPWITAIGGVSPVVSTTTPHSAPNDLSYAITAASTEQGVSWTVPAVPGQQYTASAYVRQTAAVSQEIAVGGLTTSQDAFNRTTTGGWGTADVGGSWTNTGGSASDYSVLPGLANIEGTTVNVVRTVTVGASARDCDTIAYVTVDQVATGAAIRAGVVGRRLTSTTMYFASADFNTDQSVTFAVRKLSSGTETTLTSTTMPFPYATDTSYGIRLKVQGANLSASMWQATSAMPSTFTLTTTDGALNGAGPSGTYQKLVTGNTNTNPNTTYASYSTVATSTGSTTTTTGAYVRLSVTFTATAPTHTVQVTTTFPGSSGTVLVDDVQYEQGASASTFGTTGPTLYGVWRGFVERWPSQWLNAGFLGLCQATAVDAFEALNLYTLFTEYVAEVLSLGPAYYWPLSDAAGSTLFGEVSGNNGPPLVLTTSKYGAGTNTATAGTSTLIPGDSGGTGLALTQDGIAATGFYLTNQTAISLGANTTTYGFTITGWMSTSLTSIDLLAEVVGSGLQNDNITLWPLAEMLGAGVNSGFAGLTVDTTISSSALSDSTGVSYTNDDGLPHMFAATVSLAANSMTLTFYRDGSANGTRTINPTTVFGSASPDFRVTKVYVAADATKNTIRVTQGGTFSHIALWNRALSSAEITALWTAGNGGNAGETSGARVARYVASAWTGLTSIDTGNAVMGISTVTTGTPVLQACQDVTVSEQGNFYVDRDGQVTFVERDVRYLNLTSRYTFGEDESLGEYPYEDEIEYDLDPTFVYGTVTVNNADGVTASVSNLASQRSYFPRSNTTGTDLLDDDQAVQTGYWQLNTHDQPTQRIASITLDPMGNQRLWPVILGLEIGDRVTVKRRPKAANGGSGLTMSGDFFVENISHTGIDLSVQNSTWKTTLLLSPFQETSGVFIFDNATYGTFDGQWSRFAL